MCAPSMPEPPDPKETAAAQTGTNVSTAQANAALGNVNQITPYGNLTYSKSGSQFITDPTGGQTYWKSPTGEYQTAAPTMQTGAATTHQVPIYSGGGGGHNGDGGRTITGYRTETVPGTSSAPEGWTQVQGYEVPTYTATQSLSPSQQAIFNQSQTAQKNLAATAADRSAFLQSYLGKPMDYSGVPAAGNASSLTMPNYQKFGDGPQLQSQIDNAGEITRNYGPADQSYSTNTKAVEDAMYSRLNPQMDQQRAALETQLANQGIRVGSDAYANSMKILNQGQNDQRTSVLLASGQEQSRLADLDAQRAGFQNAAQAQQYSQNANNATFGNTQLQQMFANENQVTGQNNQLQDSALNAQLSRFNAQNQAHTQGLSEAYAARQQPLNEITGLLNGSQIQQPNFVNTNMPTIPTVDYAGLVNDNYNQRLAIAQQQAQASQGILGGLFGLGGKLIGLSDDDAKRDKSRVIDLDDNGTGLWTYNYKDDPKGTPKRLGLMASEVEKSVPEAVSRRPDGYRQVDYGKALTGLFALGAH